MIVHDELGVFKYDEVFLVIDEPALFTGKFSKSGNKYVGIMVESYFCEDDTTEVKNFYFTGVADNEIRLLKKTPGALRSLFFTRPVMFLHRRTGFDDPEYLWVNQDGINPLYMINERATLS